MINKAAKSANSDFLSQRIPANLVPRDGESNCLNIGASLEFGAMDLGGFSHRYLPIKISKILAILV